MLVNVIFELNYCTGQLLGSFIREPTGASAHLKLTAKGVPSEIVRRRLSPYHPYESIGSARTINPRNGP
jgi:hypothetical protein